MTQETIEIIKWIATGLSLFAYVWYIGTIIWGKTRTSRTAWWILSLVWIVVFMSSLYLADGTTFLEKWHNYAGAGISLAYIAGGLLIGICTIWKHNDDEWGTSDYLYAGCAAIALVLFLVFQFWLGEGYYLWSLALGLLADFFGILPIIIIAWKSPKDENAFAWTIEAVAGIVSLFAVANWTWTDAGIADFNGPVYLTIVNGIITILLLRRFLRKKKYQ